MYRPNVSQRNLKSRSRAAPAATKALCKVSIAMAKSVRGNERLNDDV